MEQRELKCSACAAVSDRNRVRAPIVLALSGVGVVRRRYGERNLTVHEPDKDYIKAKELESSDKIALCTLLLTGAWKVTEYPLGSLYSIPDDMELRTDHGSVYTGDDCAKLSLAWNLDRSCPRTWCMTQAAS